MSKKRNTRNTKKGRKQLKGKLAGEIKAVTSLPPQGKDGIYYLPFIPKKFVRAEIQKAKESRSKHPNCAAVIYSHWDDFSKTLIKWYNRKVLKLFGKSAMDLFLSGDDVYSPTILEHKGKVPEQGDSDLYYNPFMPEGHMIKGMPRFFEESDFRQNQYGFLEGVDHTSGDYYAIWANKDEVDSQFDDPMEYFLCEAYTLYLDQIKAENLRAFGIAQIEKGTLPVPKPEIGNDITIPGDPAGRKFRVVSFMDSCAPTMPCRDFCRFAAWDEDHYCCKRLPYSHDDIGHFTGTPSIPKDEDLIAVNNRSLDMADRLGVELYECDGYEFGPPR